MQTMEPAAAEQMTWRLRGRAALWVLLFALSLAALGAAAAMIASIALVYPQAHFSQWSGTTPAFSQAVADGAMMWPFWLAGAFVLSVLVALFGWWRTRTAQALHFLLALLTCLNLMLAFAATGGVLAGYFVLPPTKAEPLLREDASR